MPNCRAFKVDFTLCARRVANEGDMCGTHANQHATRVQRSGPHVAGRCEAYLLSKRWCSHAAVANGRLCTRHHRIQQEKLEQIQAEREDFALRLRLLNQQPQPTWQQVTDLMIADTTRNIDRRYRIAWYFFRATNLPGHEDIFRNRWMWAFGGRRGPEPGIQPPVTPQAHLGLLATDNQNVHTTPVTEQTNKGLDKILKVPVPKSQDTQRTLTHEWLFNLEVRAKPPFNIYLNVINDINKWFNTKTCRVSNDKLYYNTLRGTVALINGMPNETRAELFQRLWEECSEAVGMCCDGHITRLCNVFVGFDDAFAPPIPFGEILQNKMSAIASMEVEDEEKRRQANAFFDEHAVAPEQRVAWLEAF